LNRGAFHGLSHGITPALRLEMMRSVTVFRFEELAFELITPGFYKVFSREMEIGELNAEELRFRAARRVV
jgi:hypothetical protein